MGPTASEGKEVVLWIIITLKNPSPSVGIEPANLGSSGEHANHQSTEGDNQMLNLQKNELSGTNVIKLCNFVL
jgi:hypothetical protein